MKQHRALWYSAVALFCFGMWFTVARAESVAGVVGDVSFSWGQVCVLMAVAAAWGDMRSQVKDLRKDVDELRKPAK